MNLQTKFPITVREKFALEENRSRDRKNSCGTDGFASGEHGTEYVQEPLKRMGNRKRRDGRGERLKRSPARTNVVKGNRSAPSYSNGNGKRSETAGLNGKGEPAQAVHPEISDSGNVKGSGQGELHSSVAGHEPEVVQPKHLSNSNGPGKTYEPTVNSGTDNSGTEKVHPKKVHPKNPSNCNWNRGDYGQNGYRKNGASDAPHQGDGLLNGTTPHKATLNVESRSVNGVASNPLDGEKPNGSSHRNGIGRTSVKQKLGLRATSIGHTNGHAETLDLDIEPYSHHERLINRNGAGAIREYQGKRALDLTLGFFAMIIFLMVTPFIALGIKLSSRGPVFFRQKRTGKGGSTFICYKFRTMKTGSGQGSDRANGKPDITIRGDHRIFAFGRFLRFLNLDELPQIINVIRGDMSLVGPRPYPVDECAYWNSTFDDFYLRYSVKPGITGFAQVKGYRGGTLDVDLIRKRTDYDLIYVQKNSLLFDIKTIAMTVTQMANLKTNGY